MKQSQIIYENEIKQIQATKILIEESLINLRREVIILAKYKMTAFSRQEIYDEIWLNSTSRTAKKYDVPYQKFKESCEKYNIPLPSNSYWASLSVGKKVEKTPLPESEITAILLPVTDRSKPVTVQNKTQQKPFKPLEVEQTTISTEKQKLMLEEEYGIKTNIENGINTYDRNTLYEEIWNEPITKVAKKYGVSDVMIHKICKSLNIPKPPAGYWRKIETGHNVPKIPLPPSDDVTTKTGLRSTDTVIDGSHNKAILDFLSDDEKQKVISAAQKIIFNLSDESTILHSVLKANKAKINSWKKDHKRDISASRKRDRYYSIPKGEPPLYYDISDESLPRVHCLVDTLFKCVESLGGKTNDDLSLEIRGETVTFKVIESESKIVHVKTKEELRELEKYEKEKQKYKWASKPQIRSWDYIFNGKIKLCVFEGKYYKDTNTSLIENQLGNILIDLYEKSEIIKVERKKREEEERLREEKRRKEEELIQRRDIEIDRTIALVNETEDFAVACKIRKYIEAVSSKPNLTDEDKKWIEWAKNKADWYDPTVKLNDDLLGEREHSKDEESKKLKKSRYSWW